MLSVLNSRRETAWILQAVITQVIPDLDNSFAHCCVKATVPLVRAISKEQFYYG